MLGLTAETGEGPFIEPASRVQWVDKLLHLTRFSEFTLVLEGLDGAGKTTLIRQLRPTGPDSTLKLTEITLSANTDTSELLGQIISQLPEHSQQKGDDRARLQYLYSYGQALKNAGQHWVLVVDEAQHLSAAALDILMNFMIAHHGDGHPPQLLLAGTPELGALLSNSHLATSQAGRIHRMLMGPLSADESTLYLQQKFPAVAKQPAKQVQKLIQEAQGLPGELDRLAAMLMHTGKVGNGRKIAAVATAPLALSAESAVASPAEMGKEPVLNVDDALSVVASGGDEAIAPVTAKAPRGSARSFPLSGVQMGLVAAALVGITGVAAWQFMPDSQEEAVTGGANGDARVSMQLDLNVEEPPEPISPERLQRSTAREELEKRLAAYEKRAARPVPVEPLAPESDQPPLPQERVITELTPVERQPEPAPETEQPRIVSQQPVPAEPATAKLVEPVPVPPAVQAQPEPKVVKPVAPAPAPVVTPPAPAPAPAQQAGLREQELLSWPATGFTLQLQGSRASKSALEFLRRQPDRSNFYYFTTIYKGGPWHVVVYGRYPDRAAAMAAVKNLPAELRNLRPWARTIRGVQADIRKK